jgi:amino acid adenylation domain-containing protein/non-ribosomal peptide synthase protein (TIGR01720 family)
MNNSNISIPETESGEDLAFWRKRLVLIDTDRTNAGNNGFLADEERPFLTEELRLSNEFRDRLANITDDPLTTFGIITSIFALLFSRYQSLSAAVFMIPFLKSENDDQRMFPLVLQQEKNDTIREYLSNSVQVIEDCFNYDGCSIDLLAKEEFGWDTTVISDILIFSDLHSSVKNEKQFDIKINIDPNTCNITFEYNPLVFPEYRAKLIQGHLGQIEKAFDDINAPVSAIEILTQNEVEHLFSLNPAIDENVRETLIDLFSRTVKSYPDHIALQFEGNAITYRELDIKSSRLAQYLKELGTNSGSAVALMTERSDLMIIAILGILKSGAAYVPVDPAYPKERIEYLLTSSGAATLLTTSDFLFDIPFFAGNIFAIDLQLNDLPEIAEDFNVFIDAESLAYIIFTSGSTGKPKGVEIPHKSVVNYLNWAKAYYFHHNPDGGSFPLFTPVSFDLTITSIFIPLIRGKQIEIFGNKDAVEILGEIFSEQGKADTVKLTPSHISLLVDIPARNVNVRTLIVGGEALREDHVAIVKAKWPDIIIFNEYGPTEATVGCTAALVTAGNITIGRPIANTAIYILDQNKRLLPIGATGEMYIGGICLAKGYCGQLEQTLSVFIDSPFVNGEKIYHTGDVGTWLQDGTLKYTGRKDAQLKIRGYRVEPGEIENILLEIPGVKDAAVVPRFNNVNTVNLVAFYTSDNDKPLKNEEIEDALAKKLPPYMRPSLIICIENMPLTPNFKIDRQKLAEMEPEVDNENYAAPVSEIEQSLVNIFREVLGREKIGVSDNFFAIGGDSIIGIQIVSRANREGIMITLKQLFKQLTISGLAAVAEKAVQINAEQGFISGNIELTPIHKLFFEQQFPNISHYNQSLVLNVAAGFDPVFMEAALLKIMEHHDVLRMRVKLNGNNYEEYIPHEAHVIPNFSVKEFTGLSEGELQNRLSEDMGALQAGFNVFNGPVLAARYYNLGAGRESMLFLAAHHLVIDGVSWRIFLEDLSLVYNQLKSGRPFNLPKKTSSFKDWAAASLSYSASGKLEKEISFWMNERWMNVNPLPAELDGRKENNTIKNSLTHSVRLSDENTQALISTAHTAYNTNVNDLLLAALVTTFNDYTGQRNLLISMEGHGREDVFGNIDIARTIGWFTSIYPVLLELDDTNGSLSTITSVKEQLRCIPDNGVGYGFLKYNSQEEYIRTGLASQPQPEVIFNYLGQSAQALALNSDWEISTLQAGGDQDGEALRNYLIEINAIVINDSLTIDWTYCPLLHSADTIKKLAAGYCNALNELITHCLDTEAGGFTPSDFPETGLKQDQLDDLISQFKFSNQ